MPFAKGRKKTGGRKKGSKSIVRTLKEICEEKGFCFATRLYELASQNDDLTVAAQCTREGMKYLETPMSTAIQLSGPNGGPIKTQEESSFEDSLIEGFKNLVRVKYSNGIKS